MFANRAGKGTLFMAEQNAFHQVFGQRAAVYGHERFASALAFTLDGTGYHFLAGAAFAFYQNRNIRVSGTLAELHHAGHCRTGDDQVVERH